MVLSFLVFLVIGCLLFLILYRLNWWFPTADPFLLLPTFEPWGAYLEWTNIYVSYLLTWSLSSLLFLECFETLPLISIWFANNLEIVISLLLFGMICVSTGNCFLWLYSESMRLSSIRNLFCNLLLESFRNVTGGATRILFLWSISFGNQTDDSSHLNWCCWAFSSSTSSWTTERGHLINFQNSAKPFIIVSLNALLEIFLLCAGTSDGSLLLCISLAWRLICLVLLFSDHLAFWPSTSSLLLLIIFFCSYSWTIIFSTWFFGNIFWIGLICLFSSLTFFT